jgi:[protein-PII] uridylyltransferase
MNRATVRKHSSVRLRVMTSEESERFTAFVASMPPAYRQSFDLEATRLHAAVVGRRAGRGAHVEIWRELSERVVAICVVADDKPGLLSSISAALVELCIDVVSADAYCRTRADGAIEAVDFLWIRRLPTARGTVAPIRAKDILALAEAIEHASTNLDDVLSQKVATTRPAMAGSSARVRFDTSGEDGATTLTVEAVDRPGLLLAVTQALFRAGVQIVGLRATTENGSAVDRFQLAEPNGQPLKNTRLLELQCAVLGALDEGMLSRSA